MTTLGNFLTMQIRPAAASLVGILRPVGIWGHLQGENIQSYHLFSPVMNGSLVFKRVHLIPEHKQKNEPIMYIRKQLLFMNRPEVEVHKLNESTSPWTS